MGLTFQLNLNSQLKIKIESKDVERFYTASTLVNVLFYFSKISELK